VLRWILVLSVALRAALVLSGGQFYWPDEGRYEQARKIVEGLATGEYADAWARLDSADHPLFKIVGMIPAGVEYASSWNPAVPGLFFAAFSVLNIWLLGRLARRLGAGRRESVLASALMAMSSSAFYWARHLVPYDVAATFALLALYAGTGPPRARSSWLCGVLAGCVFLAYAGYWTLGAAAVLVPLVHMQGRRHRVRHLTLAALGLATAPGALVVASAVAGGGMLDGYLNFADGVSQGSAAEGWRLPFEYLWHAEHATLAVWIASTASAAWCILAGRPSLRAKAGLTGLGVIYAALVIGSVGLETFVVYGRLARQLVPFFCLLAADQLERLYGSARPRARAAAHALAAALVVQTLVNFRQPLRQEFPAEFVREAGAEGAAAGARWLNAAHIYPQPEPVTLPPRYTVVKEAAHPLQFLPYQYEGYTPREREILRSTDIRMRLIVVPE
jgi:hypothetical protein